MHWKVFHRCVVDSPIWELEDSVIKVYLTMLALSDENHIYRGTPYQLEKDSRKSQLEVLGALRVLSATEPNPLMPVEFEGKKIEAVYEGWLLLHAENFSDQMTVLMGRYRTKLRVREVRFRQQLKAAAEAALKNGDADSKPQDDEDVMKRITQRE